MSKRAVADTAEMPEGIPDAEKALRKHLVWKKVMSGPGDDASLLAWIKRLASIGEDCRAPLERRVQQRLEGQPVEPVTRISQQMG